MAKTWPGVMMAGLVLAVAGAAAVWQSWPSVAPPAKPRPDIATEIHGDDPVPEFRLDGPKGVLTQHSLRGKWSLVFFGYTHCPDVCPTTLGLMKDLRTRLADIDSVAAPQVVFVSVDPARDTPTLLARYMAAFDPEFIGASGGEAALAPLTRALGVSFRRHDGSDAANYGVDHTATIFLIDPRGRVAAAFPPPHEAAAMAADYRRITARTGGPIGGR